jgi:hypothetical protein
LSLKKGVVANYGGHTFELIGFRETTDDRRTEIAALVSIDGGQAYAPAVSKFKAMGMNIGTPSVKTSFAYDLYLTLEPPVKASSDAAKIKVFIKAHGDVVVDRWRTHGYRHVVVGIPWSSPSSD